ncbi:MAG: N-acetylmuramoyl-L-alanine amidase [Planctomycetaceae bacterium]|nr:N-acetylmuramoyl-L-alanine amidase [Planctomycetaceae bacterium]
MKYHFLICLLGICIVRGTELPVVQAADLSPSHWQPGTEMRSWKYVVLHHSGTEAGSVASIDQFHKTRLDAEGNPWRGIGYHFVIGNGQGMPDGKIEATFRWQEQCEGAHAGITLFNQFGIGICLIGNFDDSAPTKAQLVSLKKLLRQFDQQQNLQIEAVTTHGIIKATRCPGTHFPVEQFSRTAPSLSDPTAESLLKR